MLSFVRSLVRSKFMLIVIGLLIVGLASTGLPSVFSSTAPRGLISAGERFIVQSDIDVKLDEYAQRVREQTGTVVTRQELAQRGDAARLIQELISSTAILSFADQNEIAASRFVVTDLVANSPAFKNQVTGEFDSEVYQDYVARVYGDSRKDFEKRLKDDFTVGYVADAVSMGFDTPDAIANVFLAVQSEERRFSYVSIPASVADDNLTTPTEDELRAFYTERSNLFAQPERRSITVFSVSPSDFIDDITPSDEELLTEYNNNQSAYAGPETRTFQQITAPDRRSAQAIVDQLASGRELEEIIDNYPNAAHIERVAKPDNIPDEELRSAVFRSSIGGIFGPLEIDGKWLVTNVTAIEPGLVPPFEDVKADIRQTFTTYGSERAFEDALETLYDLFGGGFGLEEISDEMSVPLISFAPIDARGRFKNNQASSYFRNRPEALQTINNFVAVGETSEILEANDNELYVVRLDALEPEHVPDFDEIKDTVENVFERVQKSEAAQNLAEQIADQVRQGQDLKNLAETYSLNYSSPSEPISRRSAPADVTRPMGVAIVTAKAGDVVISDETDGGRTVIQIENVSKFDPSQFSALLSTGKQSVEQDILGDLNAAYLTAIQEDSKIQYNADALQQYLQTLAGEQ